MELEVGVDGDDPPVGGRNPPHVSFDSDSFSAEVDSLLPREEVDVSWVLENMKKAATENQISIPEEKMQELFSLVTKVLDPATTGKITKKQIKELTLRSELLAILLDKLRVPNKKKKTPHPFRKSMTTTFQSWQPTPGKWNPTESFVEEGGEGDKQEKEKEEQEKEKEEQEKEKAVQEMRRKRAKTLLFSKSPKYNTATTLIQDDESEDEDYQMWATTLVTEKKSGEGKGSGPLQTHFRWCESLVCGFIIFNFLPNALSSVRKKSSHFLKIMASDRIRRYLNLFFAFLLSIFFGMGMLLGFKNEDIYDICGITFPLASGSKFAFYLTIPLMFLLMCRTLLARASFLASINNHHVAYHMTLGWLIFWLTLLHLGCHLNNFHHLSQTSVDELNSFLDMNYKTTPTTKQFLFEEGTGLTGVVALICLFGIMATSFSRWLRSSRYGTFMIAHLLFIPFILVVCIHGIWQMFFFPIFPFVMFPVLLIYCIDRVFQWSKGRWRAEFESANLDSENILSLSLQISEDFRYQSGQYIFLTVPEISRFSHPITLTSAPMERTISLNIRGVGNWTRELIKRCEGDGKGLTFFVQGPYGGMMNAITKYKQVIFIATGIGATPFSSVLNDLYLSPETLNETDRYLDPEWREKIVGLRDELKTYFFWMNYSEEGFQWFSRLLNQIDARNEQKKFEGHTYLTKANDKHAPKNFFLMFGMYLYFEAYQFDVLTGLDFLPHWGRPDWKSVFEEIAESGVDKVGVFMCGPPQLTRSVMTAARTFCVRCDFYEEAFGY